MWRTVGIAVVHLGLLPILTLSSWLLADVSTARGQSPIIRLEEQWELEVRQADVRTNAPQILMHFSPFGQSSDYHFEIDINHASVPEYKPGGIQVRAMQGNQCLNSARILADQRLNAQSEVITWTQIAQKQPTGWAFAIGFGNSTSWGAFGGPDSIVSLPDLPLTVQYSPTASLQSSGVIFAKNRVERLTLRSVRYYDSAGKVYDISVGQSIP